MSAPARGHSDPASAERDPAERLLVRVIELLETDGEPAVDALLAEHPEHAAGVRAFLARLQGIGLIGAAASANAARPARPERLGEFRIVEQLGQGGMGVVYRAVQESLGREVALKVIRPDQLFFPGAHDRFRREVEMVARMQHPGIVPVHAVGEHDGLPYFAMELVRGATLAEVIRRLRDRRPDQLRGEDLRRALAEATGEPEPDTASPLFDGPWSRIALRIMREVADALEHAHRRGVLHRDVKPSNIMLTLEGRVLLLDFGLAGSGGDERLTRTGSLIGSFAYMAPERLSGTNEGIDERSDVYSLGVTCWELLALELPYQSSDPIMLRALAEAQKRPRLATRNATVTWDVETVVATAMEPDAARRYASPAQFSRDLDNVLAHRPIEARAAGAVLRLRRWMQRRPAAATAAAAALLIVVGAPSIWAVQESRARERIELEARHAKRNFEQLQQAVDTMLTRVGDESLRDIPRMETVRRELLEAALHYYEGFLAERPDSPALAVEAARVQLRTADVQALLGDYAKARAEIEAALPAFASIPAPDMALRRDLANAHYRLATSARLLGDLPAAAAAAERAQADWRALAADGADRSACEGFGRACIEASLIAADRGDLQGAFALVDGLLQELARWRERYHDERWLTLLEAKAADRAGVWSFQLAMQTRKRSEGQPLAERGIALHRRARACWAQVLAGQPTSQDRADASQNAVSLAIALQTIGQNDEVVSLLTEAVDICAGLVGDFPASRRRREELANARGNLGAVLGQAGRTAECRQQQDAARAIWEQLTAEDPGDDEYWIGLAFALQGICAASFYSGDATSAVPVVEAAAVATDKALAVRPDNPSYRRVRRKIAETAAALYLATGDARHAAVAAQVLLDERLAPTEPVLAAALLARSAHTLVAAAGDGADGAAPMVAQARALLRAAIDGGRSLADIERDPALADQRGQPGFAELCAEFAAPATTGK